MTLKALVIALPLAQLIDRFLENRLDTDSNDAICAITFDDGGSHLLIFITRTRASKSFARIHRKPQSRTCRAGRSCRRPLL